MTILAAIAISLYSFLQSLTVICEVQQHHHNSHDQPATQHQHHTGSDVYFQIVEPENLRYTFRAKAARSFGVPFKEELKNVALVVIEPSNACYKIINTLELSGNIALVARGGCSFLQKCIEIERSGGIGLIVYDYDKLNDEVHIEMIDDNTSRNCSIPAISLLGKDGHMIVQTLMAYKQTRALISIPVNTSTFAVSNPPWLIW